MAMAVSQRPHNAEKHIYENDYAVLPFAASFEARADFLVLVRGIKSPSRPQSPEFNSFNIARSRVPSRSFFVYDFFRRTEGESRQGQACSSSSARSYLK